MIKPNTLVLGEEQFYSLDCHETQLNNNVLVVGCAGSGKTRHIAIPNILQATGSYVISDPKGNLYNLYGDYLRSKGYEVKRLDFEEPSKSVGYNFFEYIHSQQDILKLAHMLNYSDESGSFNKDPYWDNSAEVLLTAILAYLHENCRKSDQNLEAVLKCVAAAYEVENEPENSVFYKMMKDLERKNSKSFAVKQFNQYKIAPNRTKMCTLATLSSKLATFNTDELNRMLSHDEIDIPSIGKKKTAIFVVVSDHDRSMDTLANLFFTQVMNELCDYADHECEGNRLPVDVRFILDDFATNCKIGDFPRMISSIRSRGISTMLMIQAEAQLRDAYGNNGYTIIANCDTYIYMGGNDLDTAQEVARRCDLPMKKILYMPIGTNWIFRRGQQPVNGKNIDFDSFVKEKLRQRAGRKSAHKPTKQAVEIASKAG